MIVFYLGLHIGIKAQTVTHDPVCPASGNFIYSPELSDEFNDNGLDVRKWLDFNPTFYGRKPGFFDRGNVAVKDGSLQLTAKTLKLEEVSYENKVKGYDKFTTSIVKSNRKIKYGYFETRCKGMKAGVCNAFWLYDPLSDNPDKKYTEGNFSEEIDIFEFFGKPADKQFNRAYCMNVHRFCTPYVEALVNRRQCPMANKGANRRVNFDFWADYHVYGFMWTPMKMKWYIDGKEIYSRDNDYFTTALHIMFDCEIMKEWVGEPVSEDLPAIFCIDYLHVWTYQPGNFPYAKGFEE